MNSVVVVKHEIFWNIYIYIFEIYIEYIYWNIYIYIFTHWTFTSVKLKINPWEERMQQKENVLKNYEDRSVVLNRNQKPKI